MEGGRREGGIEWSEGEGGRRGREEKEGGEGGRRRREEREAGKGEREAEGRETYKTDYKKLKATQCKTVLLAQTGMSHPP